MFGGRFRSGVLAALLVVWFLSVVWTLLTVIICGSTIQEHINRPFDFNNPGDSVTYMQPDTIGSSGELVDSIAIDVRSHDDDDYDDNDDYDDIF